MPWCFSPIAIWHGWAWRGDPTNGHMVHKAHGQCCRGGRASATLGIVCCLDERSAIADCRLTAKTAKRPRFLEQGARELRMAVCHDAKQTYLPLKLAFEVKQHGIEWVADSRNCKMSDND